MLPLHKLEKLPRHQRLRKIAKIFAEAENRFVNRTENEVNGGGVLRDRTSGETSRQHIFFAGVAEILRADPLFAPAAQAVFAEAALVFEQSAKAADAPNKIEAQKIRRALNTIRHILIAETGRSSADWDFINAEGKLDPTRRRPFSGMFVYLEDIRSPFNVGAMFRTAESFGAEKLFLSPLCADPLHPRSQRTAMGCVDALPWERRDLFAEAASLASTLPLFALETGGTPLGEFIFPQRGILIAGSEELGVSPQALAAADASLGRVTIPCYGAKGSLNVSVAFGIVMQAWAAAF